MDAELDKKLREKEQKRKMLIGDIITGAIAFVVGVVIFLLMFFLNDSNLVDAINGCSIAGVSLIGGGLLALLARLGAFDTFAYGFLQLGHSMFSKEPNKYKDYVEYREVKEEKRKQKGKYFVPILIAGALFLVALIPLEIIFHISY